MLLSVCIHTGVLLGNPQGKTNIWIPNIKMEQLLNVERCSSTAEKLAVGLLLLLYTREELRSGNCSKPIRSDIQQLDPERLWGIKCKQYNYS